MNKRETIKAIDARLGTRKRTSLLAQVRCVLTWPFFHHAYDAIFVRRPEKMMSLYEHCVCCGRARSWVSLRNNYGKPGAVDYFWGSPRMQGEPREEIDA